MSAQELSQKLSELRAQLAEDAELDEQTRESLTAVLGEIQAAMDRAAQQAVDVNARGSIGDQQVDQRADEVAEDSIAGRVREVIEDFEAKHPRLTMTLSMIADRLAEIGI